MSNPDPSFFHDYSAFFSVLGCYNIRERRLQGQHACSMVRECLNIATKKENILLQSHNKGIHK